MLLSHLQSLPSSSIIRENVLQYIQEKVSPCILDCIFQHIPLKTAAPSGKKKDNELMPEAEAAAKASKDAIVTCSLLPYVESLSTVGTWQMASLAGSLYGMMIRLLPSFVRTWFTNLRDRSLSYSIELFTRQWCSPPLLLDEFSQVCGDMIHISLLIVKKGTVCCNLFTSSIISSALLTIAYSLRKQHISM